MNLRHPVYHYENSAENSAIFGVLSPTRQGGTYIHIYTHIFIYIHIYSYIYTHIHMLMCILACAYVCIYMNICVYILNICVYIWIYVYIYEYICIYSDVSLLQLFKDTSLVQVSFTGLVKDTLRLFKDMHQKESLSQISSWFFPLPFFFDFNTSPFWVSFVGLLCRSILWISFDFDTSFVCNSFVHLFCRSLL